MSTGEAYLAYMLRLWRTGNDAEPQWRASLENPHTGERLGFASLEELIAYLQQVMRSGQAAAGIDLETAIS